MRDLLCVRFYNMILQQKICLVKLNQKKISKIVVKSSQDREKA
ncbi:hypothetical protein HMPREF8571_0622 [Streptococcus mitis ATCC 6249]|uniref:Uncharacterized protein n=1 Tax=Streptococcus mitis ATCC 6249 TaxID=864567 RepID=E0PQ05_STRMT|nr:hypothetical protein HMPREF8571_0622 [Streptococcus mitis ATCC 6249]